jgi:hypothetical protein
MFHSTCRHQQLPPKQGAHYMVTFASSTKGAFKRTFRVDKPHFLSPPSPNSLEVLCIPLQRTRPQEAPRTLHPNDLSSSVVDDYPNTKVVALLLCAANASTQHSPRHVCIKAAWEGMLLIVDTRSRFHALYLAGYLANRGK